ncbi:hypothetical protein BDP55DRAFT_405132 [Colletotrichum godetiae]|uniref:Uncharacterized protein n=1 Tax=Colletotrichum godetiae TaxID=1209918 RepID=A0AAJ0AAI0_9PEZI|nr:uncharacterized protein BDP55DRAFT_405132 [Colletotrichum godetiae]KAK1658076.1 hypothetical protein BDP55DRAFT_405132 [Colletotrichum godetiae]
MPNVDGCWFEIAHPSFTMAMPQHTSNQGHGALTARLVAAVIEEMFACLSQWQMLAVAKDEEIHALRAQLDGIKSTNEQQSQTLNHQTVYIRSLEYELARSRVAPRPSSAASFDSYLLLASDPLGSVDEPRSLSPGQPFEHGSHCGNLQHSEGATTVPCPLEGLEPIPLEGLAPLLALAETAASSASVSQTAAGISTAPEGADATRKRKAVDVDVDGVAKKARSP